MTELKHSSEESSKFPYRESCIAFGRLFVGLFWLYEVTIGHNRKIFHPHWMGPEAGEWLRNDLTTAISRGTWGWFETLIETMMFPNLVSTSYFVVLFQTVLALAFILGVFAKPLALIGIFHIAVMFFSGHSRIPPFFFMGHLYILVSGAGLYYGLDGWLYNRSRPDALLRRIITLDFIGQKVLKLVVPILVVVIVYFLLHAPGMPSIQHRLASLDLAVLLGLSAAYMYFTRQGADRWHLIARALQMFVGYRFLHEIWLRTPVALNGLPGWSTGEELQSVLVFIAEHHWGIVGGVVNTVFIPLSSVWAVLFLLVQLAVGFMLILGVKTGCASRVGLVYLGLLIILGFTRYTPFVFGFLALAQFLECDGLRLRSWVMWLSLVLFVSCTLAAAIDGIIPGDYREKMGAVMAAMVAMFALMFFLTAMVQNSSRFHALTVKLSNNTKPGAIS